MHLFGPPDPAGLFLRVVFPKKSTVLLWTHDLLGWSDGLLATWLDDKYKDLLGGPDPL